MDAHEFLKRQRMMRLATVGPDGAPHVVPVWYVYRDGAAYIGTNSKTAKAKNVRRTGRASFCVDEGVRAPLYGVMCGGEAALLTGAAEVRRISEEILLRYFDDLRDPSAQTLMEDTDCIISVRVQKLTSWS